MGKKTATMEEHKPGAFEVAWLAAALGPSLAKAKPAKAVELARQLLSAAQKNIDRPKREDRRIDLEYDRAVKLFPDGERVSIPEAYERWVKPEARYKTLRGFITALKKEDLTMEFPVLEGNWIKQGLAGKPFEFEELTSRRAVDALFGRQDERKKKNDRDRKRRPPNGKLPKIIGKFAPQKRNSVSKDRKTNIKKRNGASKKRKI